MYNYGNYATQNYSDDRFFGVPFLVGGIAGTALGYGLASNQNNQGETFYPVYPTVPMYPTYYQTTPIYSSYPTYSTSNNYYY